MNTKTVFSVQYDGSRYQVREKRYSSNYVIYDVLQDRRVLISGDKFITKRTAILELLQILRLKIIQS